VFIGCCFVSVKSFRDQSYVPAPLLTTTVKYYERYMEFFRHFYIGEVFQLGISLLLDPSKDRRKITEVVILD
jgi:hypothetical protein